MAKSVEAMPITRVSWDPRLGALVFERNIIDPPVYVDPSAAPGFTTLMDGTADAPSLAFDNEGGLGLWRIGQQNAGFSGSLAIKGPRPWVDVRAYGAVGDGTTDDTTAIQAAIAAAGAAAVTTQPSGGYLTGSFPTVFLPVGHYKITAALTFVTAGLSYVRIVSDGRAVIEQVTAATDILDLRGLFMVEFHGLSFVKGKRHILFGNNNFNGTQLIFSRCEFQNSSDWSIETTLTGSWGTVSTLSATMRFVDCKWSNNNRILKNVVGLRTTIEGQSWLQMEGSTAVDGPQIENEDAVLILRDATCTTPIASTPASAVWVKNAGRFYSRTTRYGGENSGIPVVDNFGAPQSDYPYNNGAVVDIEGGAAAIGTTTGGRLKFLVRFNTHVPQLLRIVGVEAITRDADNYVVDALAGGGLAAYLAALAANVAVYVELHSNIGWNPIHLGGVPTALYTTPLDVYFNQIPGLQVIGDDAAERSGLRLVNTAGGVARVWRITAGEEGVANDRLTIRDITNARELFRLMTPGDGDTTLAILRNVGGVFTLQQVTMGVTDSGGAGFKLLRIPN